MKSDDKKAQYIKAQEEGNKVKDFLAKLYMILTGATIEIKKEVKKED